MVQSAMKHLMEHFDVPQDEKVINLHVKLALNSLLHKGIIVQVSGKGAAGSVQLALKVEMQAAGYRLEGTLKIERTKETIAKVPETKKPNFTADST